LARHHLEVYYLLALFYPDLSYQLSPWYSFLTA
jgi:hypothetical protein